MKKRFIAIGAVFLLGLHTLSLRAWHTAPDQWKEPRIFHSEFDDHFKERIRISPIEMGRYPTIRGADKMVSPNKAYWYVVHSPDTMKAGPWSTEIIVYNERPYLNKIELIDHAAQYLTKTRWINEKLLYVEFWWGRVLGTYFIYDVEKEKIIIREMVNEGTVPYQQWRQNKSPSGESRIGGIENDFLLGWFVERRGL